jgi:hypothetical protein
MVTLTLRHHLGSVLPVLLTVLRYAWGRVCSGGAYMAEVRRFGIVGWIGSLEITWGRNAGFHPHLHVLVLTDIELSPDMARALGVAWFDRWQRAVRRKGADTLEEHGLHVRVCDLGDLSTGALGDYLSKVGHEAAGAHMKEGRDGSFSILGLLREVVATYDADLIEVWWTLEDAIAGKRRKFLTWSEGAQELRARAGHRTEKTDEELAAEDEGGRDLIAIDREDWGRVVVELAALLDVAETEGVTAATGWLTDRGVGWRPVTAAPRRSRAPDTPEAARARPRGRRRAGTPSGPLGDR